MNLNPYALPWLITDIYVACIGLIVFLQNRRSKINIIFGLFCLSGVIWLTGFTLMFTRSTPAEATFWARIGLIGVAFIPIFGYHFVVKVLGAESRNRIILALAYALSLPTVLFSQSDYIYESVKQGFWGYYPLAGRYYALVMALFVALFLRGAWSLFASLRRKDLSALKKQQLKFIFLAYLLGSTGAFDYLGKFPSITLYPFGYVSTLVFISLIAFAILKYRFLDINIFLMRTGIFLFVFSIVLGFPFGFGYATGKWVWALVIMGVSASLGPSLFLLLKRKAEGMVLARQRHYQEMLLALSSRMTSRHDLGSILKELVQAITGAAGIEYAAVYPVTPDGNYALEAINADTSGGWERFIARDSSLIRHLKETKKPCTFEDLPPDAREGVKGESSIDLIMPSFMEDRLLGIIMLGGKKNKRPYSADDIQVFLTLANQMAVAIDHDLFLNDQKKSLNAETMGLVERLADGMAYQLRIRLNRCSVIAGAHQSSLQNFLSGCGEAFTRDGAQRKSLEYLRENSDALLVNLRKTENIIRNITFFARLASASDDFSTFYLGEELERIFARLREKHRLDALPISVHSGSSDALYAIRPLLSESLYALLDNCLDAINAKRERMKEDHHVFMKPEIKLSLTQGPGRVTIEIRDNGIGIREEDRAMIFTPFFTTKPADGTAAGLGLAVARRVIEELHKGRIRFESVYTEGTTFVIELPRG